MAENIDANEIRIVSVSGVERLINIDDFYGQNEHTVFFGPGSSIQIHNSHELSNMEQIGNDLVLKANDVTIRFDSFFDDEGSVNAIVAEGQEPVFGVSDVSELSADMLASLQTTMYNINSFTTVNYTDVSLANSLSADRLSSAEFDNSISLIASSNVYQEIYETLVEIEELGSVHMANPDAVVLTDGVNVSSDPNIDITDWDFANISIVISPDSSESIDLEILVSHIEAGETIELTSSLTVDVPDAVLNSERAEQEASELDDLPNTNVAETENLDSNTIQETDDVPVDEVDALDLDASDASTGEDTQVSLNLSYSLEDTDGSETVSLTVSDIPEGAVITDGTNTFTSSEGSQSTDISGWDLEGLTITPAENDSDNFTLNITAVNTEAESGDSVTSSTAINVNVDAVADTPTLSVSNSDNGDGTFDIDLSSALSDSSETLSINIADIPEGAVITDGSNTFTASGGSQDADVSDWDLNSLSITVPDSNEFSLDITSTSTEVNGDTASSSISLPFISVGVVLAVNDASTSEEAPVSLHISANLMDTDGSESLTLTVDNIPEGAVLTDGNNTFAATSGSQSTDISGWDLESLAITPATNDSDNFTLNITAMSTESGDSSTSITYESINVTVTAVADAPALTTSYSNNHDGSFTLTLDASLTDSSETLSDLTISNLEDGVSLTDGSNSFTASGGNESVDISSWDLNSLEISPNGNDTNFSFSASSVESNGDTATTTVGVDLDFADAPTITSVIGVSAGMSDPLIEIESLETHHGHNIVVDTEMDWSDISGDYTISLTVDLHRPKGGTAIFSKTDAEGAENELSLQFNGHRGRNLLLNHNDTSWDTGIDKHDLVRGEHDLVVQYEDGTASIFLDGNFISSGTLPQPMFSENGHTNIGGNYEGNSRYGMHGEISDFQIYNESYTPEQLSGAETSINIGIYDLNIDASLTDTDGSETLALEIDNVPDGVTISDGSNSFTGSEGSNTVDISSWDSSSITVENVDSESGAFDLTINATSTETATGESSTTRTDVTVGEADAPSLTVGISANEGGTDNTFIDVGFLDMDNVNDIVVDSNSDWSDVSDAGEYTISLNIDLSNGNQHKEAGLFSKTNADGSENEFSLAFDDNDDRNLELNHNGSVWGIGLNQDDLNDAPHDIVVQYDGEYVNFYLDGELYNTTQMPPPEFSSDGYTNIGGDYSGDNNFRGEISDFAIFDAAYTPEQVADLDTGSGDGSYALDIDAILTDTDGSESLTIDIDNVPDGVTVSDGSNSFTGSEGSDSVDISSWDTASITVQNVESNPSVFDLTINATSTEIATGDSITTSSEISLGTPGSDTLYLSDTNFEGIDLGAASDTIALVGESLHLDLTSIDNGAINGVETIDLGNGTGNQLTVDLQDIIDLSSESDIITIDGDSSDHVVLADGGDWTNNGVNGDGYVDLSNGSATLLVDQTITIDM
ncbi:MAG: hypothetical protein HRT89_05575 [Lentisphaeria bacterium]|nr:hypothetical protein [Lentisphaeria bacterium]NQZ67521.1 hypothetical protein [Lentisphaeria bacterium]